MLPLPEHVTRARLFEQVLRHACPVSIDDEIVAHVERADWRASTILACYGLLLILALPCGDMHRRIRFLGTTLSRAFALLTSIGQMAVSKDTSSTSEATSILFRCTQRRRGTGLACDGRARLTWCSLRGQPLMEAKLSFALSESMLRGARRSLDRVRSRLHDEVFEGIFELRGGIQRNLASVLIHTDGLFRRHDIRHGHESVSLRIEMEAAAVWGGLSHASECTSITLCFASLQLFKFGHSRLLHHLFDIAVGHFGGRLARNAPLQQHVS